MLSKYVCLVGVLCLLITGCSFRQAGYTATGAGLGGTAGYFVNRDKKEAAIGALGGALVGNIVGQWQDKSESVKRNKDYEEGYKKAQLDAAVRNWDKNTGKDSVEKQEPKRLVSFMVPKRQENDVIYDQHEITIEDYR